ncbi:MAG: hypothetical protein ACYTFY_13550, partial [Planctomycetota bacterium]
MNSHHIEEPDDLIAAVQPFAEGGFNRICWGTTAGSYSALYFSKYIDCFGTGRSEFLRLAHVRTAAVMQMFKGKGIDPFDMMKDYFQGKGLEFWADNRICHSYLPGEHDDTFHTSYILDNNDKRVLDR